VEYRAWLERVRTDLRGRLGDAFEELVSDAAERGDWGEAVAWSEQWAAPFPHDERAHTTWIESLVRAGRAREAISRWEEYAARVRRDLGLEPSEAIRHLAGTLGSADRAGARGVLSPGSAALFTPDLVARDGALAELDAAWRAVEAGGSATVLIEGEDGFGRTLLCNRFLQSIGTRRGPALVLRAQAREEKQDLHLESACELLAPLLSAPGLGGASDRALKRIRYSAASVSP